MKLLGFIRDTYVYFLVCYSKGDEFNKDDAEAVFCYTSGEEVRNPLNFFSEGELEVESWVNIKKPKSYGAEGFFFLKSKLPSEREALLQSAHLELAGKKVGFYSTDFSLDRMLVTDFETFQKFFSYAKGRHVDSETVRFIARNNLRFSGFNDDISSTVIITSFSIYCYKSLAVNSLDVKEIGSFYEKAMDNVRVLDSSERASGSIRVDFFSRELSICTAYAQVLMSSGALSEAKSVLKRLLEGLSKGDYSRYYYNLVRCLCFYMALGDEKDWDSFSFDCFSRELLLKPLANKFHELPHWYLKELSEALFILSHLLRVYESGNIKYKDRIKLVKVASRATGVEYYKNIEKHLLSVK